MCHLSLLSVCLSVVERVQFWWNVVSCSVESVAIVRLLSIRLLRILTKSTSVWTKTVPGMS